MKLTLEIICFIILAAPILWEFNDDKKGDSNKRQDVILRIAIAGMACLANYILIDKSILKSALMCFALFFLIFDYAIASVFASKGKWFSYLGKKGWFDNLPGWKKNHWVRFGIKLSVFIGALIYYF